MSDVIDINEERLAFYHQIGLAITHWAHVEFALSWIVGHEFSKTNYNLAVTGFLSIENFRSKLQYADTVVQRREMPANGAQEGEMRVSESLTAITRRSCPPLDYA